MVSKSYALVARSSLCAAVVAFLLIAPLVSHAQMHDMPMDAKAAVTPSTSLTMNIGGKVATLGAADLQAMPQNTVTVHNEHTNADERYTGVLLGDLLAKYGLPVDKTTHRRMLNSYIKAEGTDKYWVLYSVTEIEPTEHNGTVLIALTLNGKPLAADGEFKLIDSEDKKPERWVRNLSAITVKAAD